MKNETVHIDAQQAIDSLNTLLRSELSAVESYHKALDKADESRRGTLEVCLESHRRRVALLAQRVASMGGEAPQNAGLWGTLANVITTGAGLLGEKAVIAALEEGEDRLRDEYESEMRDMDPLTAHFVASELVEEQNKTHDALSEIKRWLI